MTYKEALNAGYRISDTSYQRGYISRRADPLGQEVKTAGGKRTGQLYVLLPCWSSSQYCIRQYLIKE